MEERQPKTRAQTFRELLSHGLKHMFRKPFCFSGVGSVPDFGHAQMKRTVCYISACPFSGTDPTPEMQNGFRNMCNHGKEVREMFVPRSFVFVPPCVECMLHLFTITGPGTSWNHWGPTTYPARLVEGVSEQPSQREPQTTRPIRISHVFIIIIIIIIIIVL